MSGWQLDPQGINTTLQSTETAFLALSTALSGMGESVQQPVIDGGGGDGIVAGALQAFLVDQRDGRLKRIGETVKNTLNCTSAAANCYFAGDEQMAQNSITAAGKAASTSDTTRF
ncbi:MULTISPECIES: DUF6507 family protein [unclassified Leucobacter]|uniref:DUF6507 family protein n=1 Tax=unclassified Leucobacter TaxID=2621730 RepID=UPI00117A9569|nr:MULTISPECIES: DUF6507 family protein [unclassified Leucobacter]